MKPGLRMMMMQPKPDERMDYDDHNRRRIGFGANEERRIYPRTGDDRPTARMPYYPGTPVWPDMPYGTDRPDDGRRMTAYRDADRYTHDQRRPEQRAKYGHHAGEDDDGSDYELTRDNAIEWMQHLQNEDPAHPTGPRWTMDEVKQLAQRHGITEGTEEFVGFWAAMNMLYSDYYPMFKELGVAQPENFAKMAKAFMHDKDAMDHKLGRYYHSIVKK